MDDSLESILLIEDNPGDARLIREMLSEVDLRITDLVSVDRLSAGLAMLARQKVDLVLLDLSLPDSHGLDTCNMLRATIPEVPIIVLTGTDDMTLAVQAVRQGAQDYLVKGQFDSALLARVIRYAVERQYRLRQLQVNEMHLRKIILGNVDGILIVDEAGVVRFCNPSAAALFGQEGPDLVGSSFGFPVSAGETAELDLFRRGSDVVVAEMQAVEFEWEGEPAYLVSLRDITKRIQAEKALQRAAMLESLSILAGGVAHEFNSLLTGMQLEVSLAQATLSADDPAVQHLKHLAAAIKRAADLSQQMLAYSGKGHFRVMPLDLNRVIEESLESIRNSLAWAIVVELNLAPDLPLIKGDAAQIQQVIMNLIVNAAEAYEDKVGTIHVTTMQENLDEGDMRRRNVEDVLQPGKYVVLDVSDMGVGMDAETLDRIFDPFFTTKFTGRGLGLAVVAGVVRGHRGDIYVDSEPGRGSRFRVLFPVAEFGVNLGA